METCHMPSDAQAQHFRPLHQPTHSTQQRERNMTRCIHAANMMAPGIRVFTPTAASRRPKRSIRSPTGGRRGGCARAEGLQVSAHRVAVGASAGGRRDPPTLERSGSGWPAARSPQHENGSGAADANNAMTTRPSPRQVQESRPW